jgi:hypothetical protein
MNKTTSRIKYQRNQKYDTKTTTKLHFRLESKLHNTWYVDFSHEYKSLLCHSLIIYIQSRQIVGVSMLEIIGMVLATSIYHTHNRGRITQRFIN